MKKKEIEGEVLAGEEDGNGGDGFHYLHHDVFLVRHGLSPTLGSTDPDMVC